MSDRRYAVMAEELEKLALDPFTAGATLVAGKWIGRNIASEYGHKIPFVRKGLASLGREVAGVGARAALKGRKPMPGPARFALTALEPDIGKAYQYGFQGAKGLGSKGVRKAKGALRTSRTRGIPSLLERAGVKRETARKVPKLFREYSKELQRVPLKAKGLRRVADVAAAPIQSLREARRAGMGATMRGVGRTLKETTKGALPSLRGLLSDASKETRYAGRVLKKLVKGRTRRLGFGR